MDTITGVKLIICHTSALDFIRAFRWRRGTLPVAHIRSLADCASSLSEVSHITMPAFDQTNSRLEVLVGEASKAQRSKEHVCRVLKTPPISGMFCKIGDNAYVTSPEMTFAQMATRLSFIELIMLGMELCGTYAPSPYTKRYEERPALTNRNRLISFCNRTAKEHLRGATTARKALRWVVDGSNSPAETALYMLLCLPVRLGGYGFKQPNMNPVTSLGQRASSMLGYHSMRCDLHWVDERVVVEYDSDQEHLSSQSASQDARRRNVLGYEDITVITVRKPMIATPGAFDDVARQLAKALGRQLRARDLEPTKARSNLRVELFPWLVSSWTDQ